MLINGFKGDRGFSTDRSALGIVLGRRGIFKDRDYIFESRESVYDVSQALYVLNQCPVMNQVFSFLHLNYVDVNIQADIFRDTALHKSLYVNGTNLYIKKTKIISGHFYKLKFIF